MAKITRTEKMLHLRAKENTVSKLTIIKPKLSEVLQRERKGTVAGFTRLPRNNKKMTQVYSTYG